MKLCPTCNSKLKIQEIKENNKVVDTFYICENCIAILEEEDTLEEMEEI